MGPVVEGAGERRPEPGDVRATVDRVDVVREREDVLGVGVVVLQGDLDGGRALASFDVDRAVVEGFLVPVQVPHERLEAALEVEGPLTIDPLVDERDPDALREVGGLPESLRDELERVLRGLEHLGIGPELGSGASPVALRPDLRDRPLRLAANVFLGPDAPVAGRFDPQELRQGVDDADADAVQPAGHLVAAAAELAACVEDRVDDLERVLAGRVLPDRDAATVVDDLDHVVGVDRHLDRRRVAGHRLVDRVVDHLPDEMMETSFVGRADVHAGAPADGFEALEDLDARRGVVTRHGALALAPGAVAVGAVLAVRRDDRCAIDGLRLGHPGPPTSRS